MDIVEFTIRREAITYKGELVPSKWMEYVNPEALNTVLEYMLDNTICTFSEARDEICAILEEVLKRDEEEGDA